MVSATADDAIALDDAGDSDHDDDDHHALRTAGRDYVSGGVSAREKTLKRKRLRLREGHVHLDPRGVRFIDFGGFRQVTFALRALRRKQMAPRGVLPHHLAGPGNFKSLRHGFPGLAAGYGLRHKARKIGAVLRGNNCFPAPSAQGNKALAYPL